MSESPDIVGGGGGSEMSEGLMAVVKPAIAQFDAQIQSTRNSQVVLASRIEELAEVLHDLGEDQPYDLDYYARMIGDAKKRVLNTGRILENVHDRLGKLQREIARDAYTKKQTIAAPPPAPPHR